MKKEDILKPKNERRLKFKAWRRCNELDPPLNVPEAITKGEVKGENLFKIFWSACVKDDIGFDEYMDWLDSQEDMAVDQITEASNEVDLLLQRDYIKPIEEDNKGKKADITKSTKKNNSPKKKDKC